MEVKAWKLLCYYCDYYPKIRGCLGLVSFLVQAFVQGEFVIFVFDQHSHEGLRWIVNLVVNSLILMLYCKELLMENKQRELKGKKKLESTVG